MQQTTIRATVRPDTIHRVGRLFNNTLGDVLNELLQNARRAGASRVAIVRTSKAGLILTVTDDGIGIADPATIITLGQSQWNDEIAAREDPAGMGVFSLAGHEVTISSRHASQQAGWSATILSDAWDGSRDIAVEAAGHRLGTTFAITVPPEWENNIDRLVAAAALHYPLPVFYQGSECPREPWLDKAIHTSSWNGCTIGIFTGSNHFQKHILNFHGVTVPCKLPTIAEQYDVSYFARIDIHDCPALQLVLPARKEVVANDALTLLREAALRAIFEAIQINGRHSLSFKLWMRARELGVDLPEADARLYRWEAATADSSNRTTRTELIDAGDAIRLERYDPEVEQSIGRALRDSPLQAQMVDAEAAFAGYAWYDGLTTMANVRFEAAHAGGAVIVGEAATAPELGDHLAATAIRMHADLRDGGRTYPISSDTDVVFAPDPDSWSDLDHARIVYRPGLDPHELAQLLEAAYFEASTDSDCDSWETQHRYFKQEARAVVLKLLRGPDEALCDKFKRIIQDHRWLLPTGTALHIAVDEQIDVRLERAQERQS